MSDPLVSIIVPVYKVEAYLERCLDSIIAQDYWPLEVILINDGSPDGCGEIMHRYEARWSFIQSFWQENQGLGAARNAGIDRATGKYLAFIDSDDYIEPDYISCLVQSAQKHDADVVVCNFFVNFSGLRSLAFPLLTRPKRMTGEDAARISLKLFKIPTVAWNKLYRASLFTAPEVRFPSIYYEDIATMSRLLVHAANVAIIRKPLYHYCIRKTSITGNFRHKNIDDYLEAVLIIRQFIQGEGRVNEWLRTYQHFLIVVEAQLLFEILMKMRFVSFDERRRIIIQIHKKLRLLELA